MPQIRRFCTLFLQNKGPKSSTHRPETRHLFVYQSWLITLISWTVEKTTNENTDSKSGHWFIIKAHTAETWVCQLIRLVLAFDEHKKQMSIDCNIKTNIYIVLRMNYFRYFCSPTLLFRLNPTFTFPFEGNSCQRNSFRSCGSPILLVPLRPNFTLPFEGNSYQRNRN